MKWVKQFKDVFEGFSKLTTKTPEPRQLKRITDGFIFNFKPPPVDFRM